MIALAISSAFLVVPEMALAAENEAIQEAVQGDIRSEVSAQMAETTPASGRDLGETVVTGARAGIIKNPYVTGGDANIITRREIEKHNYTTIIEAIKSVPGVRISTPGYRGGEYGYSDYNTELTINGENSIVIVVDGSPLDNDASAFSGSTSRVNLSTLPGIDDVEQIEVIKGSGAAIYGANAAGGVISITTRKGTKEPRTMLHIASGSWGHQRYSLTHTGAADDGTLRYAASISHEKSNDTEYRDAPTDSIKTYANTSYKDTRASLNIVKAFDAKRALSVQYYHGSEEAHYPITAPDYRYIDSFYNSTMGPIDPATHRYTTLRGARGYRNIFLYDAWLGSYDRTLTNHIAVKYVFDKTDEGAESFVRMYNNYTRYDMWDYSNIYSVPYKHLPEFWSTAKDRGNIHTDIEKSKGMQIQLAKRIDRHSVTGGIAWRQSAYEGWTSRGNRYDSERDALQFYVQDKVKVSDKFALTPGIHFAHYSSGAYNAPTVRTPFDSARKLTVSLYGSYDFDKRSNAYFAASQVYKPVTGYDLSRQFAQDPLQDETGWSYTAGISRKFSDADFAELNFGITDMSNAIARYSVYDETAGDWRNRAVNAERMKRSMNIGYGRKFSDALSLHASYSWVHEKFGAKNVRRNPDGTNTEDLINAYRPRNIYRFALDYDRDRWFAELAYTVYSGNDTRYFTSSSFGVLDLSVNYKMAKDLQLYLNVYNLLDTAYETRAKASYGTGAFPEPSRSFLLGVKYTF